MSQVPLHCKVEPILIKGIHGDNRCGPIVSEQVQTGEDDEQQPYKSWRRGRWPRITI